MSFGLCNAATTFERCMMVVFSIMVVYIIEAFMDDFSVISDLFEDYLSRLANVLRRYMKCNLVLN